MQQTGALHPASRDASHRYACATTLTRHRLKRFGEADKPAEEEEEAESDVDADDNEPSVKSGSKVLSVEQILKLVCEADV